MSSLGMLKRNEAPTPMLPSDKLTAIDGALLFLDDIAEYRNIVGCVHYLAQ